MNRSQHVAQQLFLERCRRDPVFFIHEYCWLYNASRPTAAGTARWLPFHLWPVQEWVLRGLQAHRLAVVLKSRQLGLSWLCLGLVLWEMTFHPGATILLFSKRDDEAVELLDERLKGMWGRLPDFLKVPVGKADGKHEWKLANGSRVKALPTTGGRSYTGTVALVDEADWVPDLAKLLNAVEPTIAAGGRLILVSSVDKSKPDSVFQRLYRAARQEEVDYAAFFCGWATHPERTEAWYEAEKRKCLAKTGALDDLHQEYPASEVEALAPRSLDKRIHPEWLAQCFAEVAPAVIPYNFAPRVPALPGLVVYQLPEPVSRPAFYVIGADPAEGNPTSDDSALTVLRGDTGEEVAALAGRLPPALLAAHIDAIGRWYRDAAVLVERNNHGHAVLLWLQDHSRLRLLCGHDGKVGWLSSTLGKTKLYDDTAEVFRNGETRMHTFATLTQLGSIEGATLRAPQGLHDDRAIAYALACVARCQSRRRAAAVDCPEAWPIALGPQHYARWAQRW